MALEKLCHSAGCLLLSAMCAVAGVFLMLSDAGDPAFVVLGFSLALIFSLHPIIKSYIDYLKALELVRLRHLQEAQRQAAEAQREAERLAAARELALIRQAAEEEQERLAREAAAKRGDEELARRSHALSSV